MGAGRARGRISLVLGGGFVDAEVLPGEQQQHTAQGAVEMHAWPCKGGAKEPWKHTEMHEGRQAHGWNHKHPEKDGETDGT